MTLQITTSDYAPHTTLDEELATLGYDAMCGWPDQRPVTASLVRSRLRRAVGAPATRMVLARTGSGMLAGAAALRYPAVEDGPARLWGPVVALDRQRHGLGTALLQRASTLWSGRNMQVRTAEIPQTRTHGCRLFEVAGWALNCTAVLLKGTATTPPTATITATAAGPISLQARSARDGDAAALARLYHAVHPEQGVEAAADTLRRWRADERFVSDGLMVVPGAGDELLAAALVYPLASASAVEPPEALLGDVLINPSIPRATIAAPLIEAAIAAGTRHGATVVRAVVPSPNRRLIDELTAAGLKRVETIHYYQAPPTSTGM